MELRSEQPTVGPSASGLLTLVLADGQYTLHSADRIVARFAPAETRMEAIAARLPDSTGSGSDGRHVIALLQHLFDKHPDLKAIQLGSGEPGDGSDELVQSGLVITSGPGNGSGVISRAMLRQLPHSWLARPREPFPLSYTVTDGKRHPLRPPIPQGEVYGRYLPDPGCRVSFTTIDPERHLDAFHRWMNDPRVDHFWELAGTREQHQAYLSRVLADRHTHPVVASFDQQPFGYFEIYWAKEDRIAPFYAVDDYDRGIHMLVGEPAFRGPHRVAAWLPSLAHYLFLDDPRTRNVVAEPRADNAKMIGYLQRTGFYKEKEFDFPHKRAAMMILPREAFFEQHCP